MQWSKKRKAFLILAQKDDETDEKPPD